MRLLLGVAAAMLFTTGTAQAKEKAADGPDKPVCKRVYGADTGSHFQSSKRVCHTAEEWKELEDATNRTLTTIRDNGGANPGALSNGGFGGGTTPQ